MHTLKSQKKYISNKIIILIVGILGLLMKKKISVNQIVKMITKKVNKKIKVKLKKNNFKEKKYLQLNSDKIYKKFKIKNKISTSKAINLTIDWYNNFFVGKNLKYSIEQFKKYLDAK